MLLSDATGPYQGGNPKCLGEIILINLKYKKEKQS